MQDIPDLHVLVKFGKGIPGSLQGPALLALEKKLRELSNDAYIEVFKEHSVGDDSKLRSEMTQEQRAKL